MKPEIKHQVLEIEKFSACTELSEIDLQFKIGIEKDNVNRLLSYIRPLIKTQYFKRYVEDIGYMESTIWLPYVRTQVIKNLEGRINWLQDDVKHLEDKIKKHNKLPWWKRFKGLNND